MVKYKITFRMLLQASQASHRSQYVDDVANRNQVMLSGSLLDTYMTS